LYGAKPHGKVSKVLHHALNTEGIPGPDSKKKKKIELSRGKKD